MVNTVWFSIEAHLLSDGLMYYMPFHRVHLQWNLGTRLIWSLCVFL